MSDEDTAFVVLKQGLIAKPIALVTACLVVASVAAGKKASIKRAEYL